LKVVPGSPDPANTYAQVGKSEIKAGETAIIKVYPVDLNGNEIPIDTTKDDLATAKFTTKV